MSDALWFVGRGGAKSGPFATAEIRRMAATGRLAPTDLVWREGMQDWAPASSFREWFATPAPAAAPNPYAAPQADWPGPPPAPSSTFVPGASRYSFAAACDLTVRTFQARWGLLVLVGLVWLGLLIAMSLPQWFVQAMAVNAGDPNVAGAMAVMAPLIGLVVNVLVGGPILAGVVLAGANTVVGRGRVADMFVGFSRYGRVLLAHVIVMVIMGVMTFACSIPFIVCAGVAGAVAEAGDGPAAALMLIGVVVMLALLIVGMALVGMRVLFTPALVADERAGSLSVAEALRLNWTSVSVGRGFSLLGFAIVVSLITALTALLCGVGYVLLGAPILIAAFGSTYALLFRNSAATP